MTLAELARPMTFRTLSSRSWIPSVTFDHVVDEHHGRATQVFAHDVKKNGFSMTARFQVAIAILYIALA